jgi:tRNA modification GTPase
MNGAADKYSCSMIAETRDSIAAIATPPGFALRGVIRCSGAQIARQLDGCLKTDDNRPLAGRKGLSVLRGLLDLPMPVGPHRVELLFWPGNQTYTRQPSAEIQCPGTPVILQQILSRIAREGIRQALPGEFTLRAFLAGRIDLPRAEAVLGTIDARSGLEMKVALRQLAGGLSVPLAAIQDELLDVVARIEAGLDFSEEDISFITRNEILEIVLSLRNRLEALVGQLRDRQISDATPRVVLAGRPNTGKSSLFNALMSRSGLKTSAMVSPIAGTTRDYLSGTIQRGNFRFNLYDTAGILALNSGDLSAKSVDAMSVAVAEAVRFDANLVLLCLDQSRSIDPWEQEQIAASASLPNTLVLVTKCDLPRHAGFPQISGAILTSASTGAGIDNALHAIAGFGHREMHSDSPLVAATMDRCASRFQNAIVGLSETVDGISVDEGDEVTAARLRVVLDELALVSGRVFNDDILDRIFSRFCIGK